MNARESRYSTPAEGNGLYSPICECHAVGEDARNHSRNAEAEARSVGNCPGWYSYAPRFLPIVHQPPVAAVIYGVAVEDDRLLASIRRPHARSRETELFAAGNKNAETGQVTESGRGKKYCGDAGCVVERARRLVSHEAE